MSALLIRSPWIDKILKGTKSWEMRGTSTRKRGRIGLVKSGTGTVVGVADLIDVVGPLSKSEFVANARKAGLSGAAAGKGLPYLRTFAWVIGRPRRLSRPVPYKHPCGAIVWVALSCAVKVAVEGQIGKSRTR